MNMLNTAKFLSAQKASGDEQELLCLWQGRDVVNKSECMCVRWDTGGSQVAAGGGDGAVRLYDGKTGQLNKTLWPNGRSPAQPKPGVMAMPGDENPVMAMRWHPKVGGKLRVAATNGTIELYDVKQGNSKATTKEPKGQQTMSIDYNGSGTRWVSGGTDKIVRVYDDAAPKEPICELTGSLAGRRGHSNRITTVRFWPFNPDVVVSAGLDGTAMVWDTTGQSKDEDGEPVMTGEPYLTLSTLDVRGESLDFDNSTMLAGSWRPMNQMQLYDLRSGKLERSIPWRKSKEPPKDAYPVAAAGKNRWASVREAIRGSCNIYAASYINGGAFLGGIVAGGTGTKEVKVFKKNDEGLHEPIAKMEIPSGVMNLHVSPSGKMIAVAATNGTVFGVAMPEKEKKPKA